jgi:antitoxin HigA-1
MTVHSAKRELDRAPTHPGAVLRDDVFPALNMPVSTAATQLGVSRAMLHRILSGTHGISPNMALRLGKFCGNGPELWLNMQRAHDLWYAEREMRSELAKIPTHRAA